MKTSENSFASGGSSMLTRRKNLDLFFWGCITILAFLLILNLQEIMQVRAWRHDALYYLGSYSGKLKEEGRWINYFLFEFLKAFPAHASALLSVSFFGGFVWIAANKTFTWETSLLISLLFLQINPLWSVIHWPAVILPAHFFLFFCAYLSRKYRYEYILALACILFHGTFNNLYNLIPLLFLNEIKTGRQLLRFLVFWIGFYVFGFVIAELMTKLIVGQFIQLASWRHPHYITSLTVLTQNLKMIYYDFASHVRTFTLANFMICILVMGICLWKKIMNIYQGTLLLCVGMACYAQVLPIGIRVDLRTVYSLYTALLVPFCFSLLFKRFRLLVLVAIIIISAKMFTDNNNSLRYYNSIISVWTEHLRIIPNDPCLNNQLIFCSNQKESNDVEKYLVKTMDLKNRIIEGLGEQPLERVGKYPYRWSPSAKSLGYHVKLMTPKWLAKCKFHSNQLYEWAFYDGAIVVRFNPELMKRIQ